MSNIVIAPLLIHGQATVRFAVDHFAELKSLSPSLTADWLAPLYIRMHGKHGVRSGWKMDPDNASLEGESVYEEHSGNGNPEGSRTIAFYRRNSSMSQ